MASRKLNEVMAKLESGDETLTGPYLCYVTNFVSKYSWPKAFTYRGCKHMKSNDLMCAKSIEGKSKNCEHDADAIGNHIPFYRFNLILTDANAGGPPLHATIFESAEKLLGIGPVEFQSMDEDGQTGFLHGICKTTPLVKVWLRCYKATRSFPEASIVVQKLEKVDDVTILTATLPGHTTLTPLTPTRPRKVPSTGRGMHLTSVESGSSSTPVAMSAGDLSGMVPIDKTAAGKSVFNLVDYFAAMSTRDKRGQQ